jgi:hypothetical protein
MENRFQSEAIHMSGYKHATIIISQEEFRRLNEADMKQREATKVLAEREVQSKALLKAHRKLEERQAEYEKLLAEMEQDIAEVEADVSREILQQQDEYYQSLLGQIQELDAENEANQELLTDARRLFDTALREEKARNDDRFNALLEQLSVIATTQDQQEETARNWIKSCRLLSRFIDEHYDHQKFCPSQFDQAVQRLTFAVENTRRGLFEAGLQSAQEAYLNFSELRVRLEEQTNKWQNAYQLILGQIQGIYSEVSSTPTIPAIGMEGEDLHIDIDLDYWSHGRYAILSIAVEKLLAMLEDDAQEFTLDDLDMVSARIIPKYKQEFEEIILEARQNAVNAQIKINVAYIAMKALEQHGFSLEETSYQEGDMRESFSALLNGLDGSNIILEVSPDPDGNNTNTLSVENCNADVHSEREYLRRWQTISAALNQVGVRIGQVQIAPKTTQLAQTSWGGDKQVFTWPTPRNTQENHYVRSNRAQAIPTRQ